MKNTFIDTTELDEALAAGRMPEEGQVFRGMCRPGLAFELVVPAWGVFIADISSPARYYEIEIERVLRGSLSFLFHYLALKSREESDREAREVVAKGPAEIQAVYADFEARFPSDTWPAQWRKAAT